MAELGRLGERDDNAFVMSAFECGESTVFSLTSDRVDRSVPVDLQGLLQNELAALFAAALRQSAAASAASRCLASAGAREIKKER